MQNTPSPCSCVVAILAVPAACSCRASFRPRPGCRRRSASRDCPWTREAASLRRKVLPCASSPFPRWSGTSPCPATSPSRTARCSSRRSARARRAISGFGRSADTEATIAAVRALGVEVVEDEVRRPARRRRRAPRPASPEAPIDCGNAGTLMRLLAGLLAGQEGRFELVGDESLSARPMERIAAPLRRMGATRRDDGWATRRSSSQGSAAARDRLRAAGRVRPGEVGGPPRGASRRTGRTTVVEPIPTRDHTERLLERAGARVTRRPTSVTVERAEALRLGRGRDPGRHLVRGAVPRRGGDRPRLVA